MAGCMATGRHAARFLRTLSPRYVPGDEFVRKTRGALKDPSLPDRRSRLQDGGPEAGPQRLSSAEPRWRTEGVGFKPTERRSRPTGLKTVSQDPQRRTEKNLAA